MYLIKIFPWLRALTTELRYAHFALSLVFLVGRVHVLQAVGAGIVVGILYI